MNLRIAKKPEDSAQTDETFFYTRDAHSANSTASTLAPGALLP
jgi:hypothetical protein